MLFFLVCARAAFHNPADCGWPRLYARFENGTEVTFNATITLLEGGRSLSISARIPSTMQVVASSYGRASWPMTLFFSEHGVPLLPWYAALNETLPWVLPSSTSDLPLALHGERDHLDGLDEPWNDEPQP